MATVETTLRFRANFETAGVYLDYTPEPVAVTHLEATVQYRFPPYNYVDGGDSYDVTAQDFMATTLFGLTANNIYEYIIQVQLIIEVLIDLLVLLLLLEKPFLHQMLQMYQVFVYMHQMHP